MSIDDRLERAFGAAADGIGEPTVTADEAIADVMRRGRRRRLVVRTGSIASGLAAAIAVVGVTAMVVGSTDQSLPAVAQDPTSADESITRQVAVAPSGIISTYDGTIVADEFGYLVRQGSSSERHRIVEGHSVESDGRFRFGPAISDGDGGFVYSVLDLDSTSSTDPGWVLWVPAGAAVPSLVASEPSVGVDEIVGVVDGDEGPSVVYTTAAGRTPALRIAPLSGSSVHTVLNGFSRGDAAGTHIAATSYTDHCTSVHVYEIDGTPVDLPALGLGVCPDVQTTRLSPDGGHLAFLDRQDGSTRLIVVDLVNSVVTYDDTAPKGRLVGFDGTRAYLNDNRKVNTTTGRVSSGKPPADMFQINDQLVLQVPGGPEVDYDTAAASSPRSDVVATTTEPQASPAWTVTVRSHDDDEAIDLDGLGVTTAGVGPYVLGAPAQDISDTSGHDLVTTTPDIHGCALGAVDAAVGVTTDDMSLVVEDGRLVRLDFSTDRFTFDGLGVGSTIDDIIRRFPEAEKRTPDGSSVLLDVLVDDPGDDGIDVVFATNGYLVASFRVGSGLQVADTAPCS